MNNSLKHVGVIGMRWGQRRGIRSNTVGKYSKKKATNSSDDFKKVSELRKKKINEMTDEEISLVIKRMDLQKRYKDLNPSKVIKGGKAAKGVLSTIGQVSAGLAGIITLASVGNTLYKKISTHLSSG